MNNRSPLYLEGRERAFFSFAIAADWTISRQQTDGGPAKLVPVARPLLHRPGKYTIKCLLRHEAQPNLQLDQLLNVEVGEAQGDDEAVLALVKKDEALMTALMNPVHPPDQTVVPKLLDLVKRFPKSSYADYARFALARAYRKGVGVDPPSDRVSRAMAADQLEKILVNRYDFKLEKSMPSRFAYLPNALILWKTVEPLGREHTLTRLDRAFPDSLEWLEEFATSLTIATSERRKEAEFVLGKKFPSPLVNPPVDTKGFIADAWKTYRKRVPKPEEPTPSRAP